MNCIVCERPAHGMCKFCGRALCKDHFKTGNYILGIYPQSGANKDDKVLVVENVVKCVECRPLGQLVPLNVKEWSL